jgi:hypothetical protein
MLTPILVASPGRTGTTLLMQILSSSDEILCPGSYPLEDRYMGLLYAAASLLRDSSSGAALAGHLTNSDDFSARERSKFAAYKAVSIDGGLVDIESLVEDAFVGLWKAFSASVSDHGIRFFAEKTVGPEPLPMAQLLSARIIYLVRDPRDIVVSVREFNAKRAFLGFAWQESDDELTYARRLMPMYRTLLEKADPARADEEPRSLSLRYEDLVLRLGEAIDLLEEWLGVSLEASSAAETTAAHMTSEDAGQSVERWRRELSQPVVELFEEELGQELRAAGYP